MTCLIYTDSQVRELAEAWMDESARHRSLVPERTSLREMAASAARVNRARALCEEALATTADRAVRLWERGLTVLLEDRGLFVVEQEVISRPLGQMRMGA